ncbi:MAG: discoidin domain-containing protein [Paludibacter sp.]|jgi:hypothetical protein|nr:discoidin domain-containing protein [Paludibacter sp.]
MKHTILFLVVIIFSNFRISSQNLEQLWQNPPEQAHPWVFWYWMQGAVSKQGITADLEAMKQIGIDGAYLMPIKGVPQTPLIENSVEQLTPQWWEMVNFAIAEAARLDLKLGFHFCDGFALAGGPWITPELSMQKVVWSECRIDGGKYVELQLPEPEKVENYYRDIAVYAFPTIDNQEYSSQIITPKISTSVQNANVQFLADVNSRQSFSSVEPCWIQYEFEKNFTCRSVQIKPSGRNYQSQRLTIEASNDGKNFKKIAQLESPRQGWQNDDQPMTHSITPTTARFFRFVYNPQGSEPGSEDLDVAKWKQSLKINYIYLSSDVKIHQFEGKNASVWRVSPQTSNEQISKNLCVNKSSIINITKFIDKSGKLTWKAPRGKWTILRIGHTSTGQTNATGGGGKGLECDKFNPEAINLQFENWFAKFFENSDKDAAQKVIKMFHLDSWECGSQNWSPVFRAEFLKRRAYDIVDYLPVMAGIPIDNIEKSEKILYDVRQTVSELVVEVFYKTLAQKAHDKGCLFSAESIAPTFTSDGLAHYKYADLPMGEFWFQSPTHDKPNDVFDAVSGAHIYGKNIVQAEGFTQLRSVFTEHPAMLKTLQDRNYAAGINRLSFHVNVLNPWLDRKPGMTLDGIGLYFQRDQTWYFQAAAWIDYSVRCQALLQFGQPVTDIAVFTGDELPRRSILPDRLVNFLPGIFGAAKVESEKRRLENLGTPSAQVTVGVTASINNYKAENFINPLRGYAYDCINPDALQNATAVNNFLNLQSGAKYKALIVPGKHPMQPNPEAMRDENKAKLNELKIGGIAIINTAFLDSDFSALGIERDLQVNESDSEDYAADIAFIHRADANTDIYFISNQQENDRILTFSFRISGKIPEIWNPVNGKNWKVQNWKTENGRTILTLNLHAAESLFVVFRETTDKKSENNGNNTENYRPILQISNNWKVKFSNDLSTDFDSLLLWNDNTDKQIKYFSGTATYSKTFTINNLEQGKYHIEFDEIYNLATVKINGIECGTLWTKPYILEISQALRNGENHIEIQVTNTWANRLMGNENFDAETHDSQTWTNARYRLAEKNLVPAGLKGNIRIMREQ